MNSREHPTKRCQKREREHEGSTRHEDPSILAHMIESNHEARSHVNKERQLHKAKALREGLTRKKDCAQHLKRGDARVQCKKEASRAIAADQQCE